MPWGADPAHDPAAPGGGGAVALTTAAAPPAGKGRGQGAAVHRRAVHVAHRHRRALGALSLGLKVWQTLPRNWRASCGLEELARWTMSRARCRRAQCMQAQLQLHFAACSAAPELAAMRRGVDPVVTKACSQSMPAL